MHRTKQIASFVGGWLDRRLPRLVGLVALALFALGLAYAPKTTAHTRARLDTFYDATLAILFAILAAIVVYQGPLGSRVGDEPRRFFRKQAFILLTLGLGASIAALTHTLSAGSYRYLFAVSLGGGGAVLTATLLAAYKSLEAQRKLSEAQKVTELEKPR